MRNLNFAPLHMLTLAIGVSLFCGANRLTIVSFW
jgi:hypothetical protein